MIRASIAGLTACVLLSACGGGQELSSNVAAHDPTVTPAAEASSTTSAATEHSATAAENEAWDKSAALSRAEVQQTSDTIASPLASTGAVAKLTATAAPIYRFFNIQTGAHLLTKSLTERDTVLNTMSQFRYEGPVFSAWQTTDTGLYPVYRFANTQTGTHLFTISETEKNNIVATMPWMRLEGGAYYAAKAALPGTTALYRFYHLQRGFHFYTASTSERDNLIANLSGTYRFEGAAYYVNATIGSYDKALASFAGKVNTSGYVNGLGESARFNEMRGMACNPAGNLYLTDSSTYMSGSEIRMITPAGLVTSFVGNRNGPYSYADGMGSGAAFDELRSVTFAANGTGYTADYKTVRSITPAGLVTTLAGSLTANADYVNGNASAARFKETSGIAVDSTGNIYVSDRLNQSIRKISTTGVVSTLAGADPSVASYNRAGYADGQGTAARFSNPGQITIDNSNNLYVADESNHRIRKITPSGLVTTVAGQSSYGVLDGQGTAAKFHNPFALAIDKATGNLYVADWRGYTVRKITPDGTVTTVAGTAYSTGIYFGSLPAVLDEVGGLAVCGGRLYIAANHAVLWTNLP